MSNKAPSYIEDLPNELWLGIFDYLDWINLFLAFYGINKRINELLVSIKVLSLYSSYLTIHSNSIYIFFKEFPITEFKEIQHLKLIYDSSYKNALNIAQHFPSLSSLISLTIDANCVDYECANELAMIYFRQHCPFLQRLYLYGNEFNRVFQITDNICLFYFPSLLYIHVNKLHYIMAIQMLDQCSQLRSFSAILFGYPKKNIITVTPIQLPNRITMGLTALKKLNLGEDDDFKSDFGSTFLELLLPCCPNLRTFSFDFLSCQREGRPFDPNWWTHVLASNNKLKRISLQLRVYGTLNTLNEETIQRFRLLPFFVRLKVNVTYTADRLEFPRMIHIYSIKN